MSTTGKQRNVFKAGIGFTIGNYLLKGVVFITTPIFARLMTTGDYGKYNAFASYESILFVILGMAIHSSYKNAFYKFKDPDDPDSESGYQKYIAATMWFLIGSFVCWMLVALGFSRPLSDLLEIDQVLVVILVAGSYASAVMNCFTSDRGIHYQYQEILIISFVSTALNVLLSIVLMKWVFPNRMYMGRILGGFIPVFVIYTVIALRYILRASAKGMKSGLAWGVRYSLPIVPHGISQVILGQFDRIMILKMSGDSPAGIYSFAYTIYSMLAVTASSLDGVWSPWFYEKRKAEDYNAIRKGSSLYILIIFLASLGVILLCPELIRILGGVKYRESVYCAIPVVAGGFFAGIYNVPCLVEYYHEKTKLIAISTASAALLNIILNAIFIQSYGYVAAAYTTLVTYVLYFLMHFLAAKKIEGKNIFPARLMILCSASMIISIFIALFLLDKVLLRIIMLVIILGVSLIYEEKKFSYLGKRMNKTKR